MNSLIRLMALLSLSYSLAILLKTGQITYYINPRFISLTKFSLGFLLLLCLVIALELVYKLYIRNGYRPSIKLASLVVLLACLTPLLFPPKMLDSSMAEQKGMMYTRTQSNAAADLTQEFSEPEDYSAYFGGERDLIPENTNAESIITITSMNYLEILVDIMDYLERYSGKEIEVDGFIMSHSALGENQYLVSRYAIACCAADAVIVGFTAEGTSPYPDNTWVKMRGKILRLDDHSLPVVQVTNIEEIAPPPDPYIYQYY
ncbi:hypothetical protein N752_09315 [Desulforamulus aquiferis]|nr:TIGR03943 family protein [Desulforamulus aquiferis]RYD05535.1 hypothetical protein N752_09315 [Desulforamulus aquiferis]